MIEKRTITVSGRVLGGLVHSEAVTAWATEHQEEFNVLLGGYDQLVDVLNRVSDDSPLLDIMPKTRALKSALKGNSVPRLADMAEGNFGFALREAVKPMFVGQMIKAGEIADPTLADKAFAIGTPSMDTTERALAVGTAGHLAERTFYQWARKQGLSPADGWKKDDWLQALDEGLLLLLAEGEEPILGDVIVKQNDEGGVGWLNAKKVQMFLEKHARNQT